MKTMMLGLSWLTFIHSLLFSLFWMSNRPFHRDVNGFLDHMVGKSLAYVSIFLGFSLFVLVLSVVAIWVSARGSGVSRLVHLLGWLYAAAGVVYIVFFYGSFVMLFRENPVQVARLGQFWQYYRLLSDAFMLGLLTWGVVVLFIPNVRTGLGMNGARLAGLGLVTLGWLLPVFFLPGSVYRTSLPAKPLLIAHRGASWLAPENTLAAMARAVEVQAYGLESDVHTSLDGVLFLMHDANLKRTTDVGVFFPGRETEHASQFTWAELSQLNAGAWFTREDPYQAMAKGLTSPSQAAAYAEEGIPRLEQYLELAEQHGKIILYDLYDPPEGHPYHGEVLENSLELLKAAQLGQRAWILARQAEIPEIRLKLPEATLAAGIDSANPPEGASLINQGYQVVNSEYSLSDQEIGEYKQAGLWVNLYTVDESWQFSRLWIRGADSVTSNNVHNLQAMRQPVLGLSFKAYLSIWLACGALAAALLWVFGKR